MDKYLQNICFTIFGSLIFLNVYAQDIEKHTWESRILILKTSDNGIQKHQDQLKIFKNSKKDLRDRKLVLYEIVGKQYKFTDYRDLNANNTWQECTDLDNGIFSKSDDFEIILIGLDGGVKLRKTELLYDEELYGLIDSMPMRVQELMHKNGR